MAKEHGKREIALVQAYRETFTGNSGQTVLHDLMANCSMLMPTYANGDDTKQVMYREGQRSVVLRILTLMETDQVKLKKLIEDSNEKGEKLYEGV